MVDGTVRRVPLGFWNPSSAAIVGVNNAVMSGRLSYGPNVREFERRWAVLHGANHAIFMNSGTSALHIAIQAMKIHYGWEDGDEILVPALTFPATANAVIHNGLKPRWVDVYPIDHVHSLTYDHLSEKVNTRTKAILPVHLLGRRCRMSQIAGPYTPVLEDSCQHVGSTVCGEMSCFSTYMAHIVTTGVGGFIVTNSDKWERVCRSLMNHGRDDSYLSIDDDDVASADIIASRYKFNYIGHSFRATEMEAAIGLAELDSLHDNLNARRANHMLMSAMLMDLEEKYEFPVLAPESPMFYPILVRPGFGNRDSLMLFMESRGIETRPIFPLADQPCYAHLDKGRIPVADDIVKRGVLLPLHHGLTESDISWMVESLGAYDGVA